MALKFRRQYFGTSFDYVASQTFLPENQKRPGIARLKMAERNAHRNGTLVFVYNAESGLFNAVTDTAHKIFSPQTYSCNLCALTYSMFGMRQSWKRFLETLERPLEFLHADELRSRYGISGMPLPVVFKKQGDRLELLIDAAAINACRTIEDLQQLIKDNLPIDC